MLSRIRTSPANMNSPMMFQPFNVIIYMRRTACVRIIKGQCVANMGVKNIYFYYSSRIINPTVKIHFCRS